MINLLTLLFRKLKKTKLFNNYRAYVKEKNKMINLKHDSLYI